MVMPLAYGVYPRVCGGTLVIFPVVIHVLGLSPRVRGNLEAKPEQPVQVRSIPACAGEPSSRPGNNEQREVYPRVCGGTCGSAIFAAKNTGLSPRVRGNPRRRA